MTVLEWGAIGELIGGIAIIVSLVYVGYQVRQNTTAVRSATAQAVHDNYAAWYINLSNDADLNRLVIKGLFIT